jgi:hypothetical protein
VKSVPSKRVKSESTSLGVRRTETKEVKVMQCGERKADDRDRSEHKVCERKCKGVCSKKIKLIEKSTKCVCAKVQKRTCRDVNKVDSSYQPCPP